MVSLPYADTGLRRSAPLVRHTSTWASLFNWRLALVLVLNVALWAGVAKLFAAATA
ncbi:hypothetical protein [Phenylobacterium sp.]|uniref:hypothetical protein n=1 Tax=Phenylobacterium sp. TaxID=1871053 RepID=UPI0035AEC75B